MAIPVRTRAVIWWSVIIPAVVIALILSIEVNGVLFVLFAALFAFQGAFAFSLVCPRCGQNIFNQQTTMGGLPIFNAFDLPYRCRRCGALLTESNIGTSE